ncbi:MAG: hypothetical protein ACTSUE_17880 [Promethearchaeota archaeon]
MIDTLAIIALFSFVVTIALYLQRQARWNHLRAVEMYEKTREAIFTLGTEGAIEEDFYKVFEENQSNALKVNVPWFIGLFLDDVGTCPVCHEWRRCPPAKCTSWINQLEERHSKGKEKKDEKKIK